MGLFGSKKPQVKIAVFGKTDLGRTRDHNEDSFLVADLTTREASLQPSVREHLLGPKGTLLLVADGMGGAASGEVASQMAIETVYDHLERGWCADDSTSPEQFATHLRDIAQVGDSRAYLIRNGEATQLTKDQSLMQRLVDAGELTEEEAEKSERKNIILQALGPDQKVKVDLTHQGVRRGDVIVVCSDGLSGQVKKEEIAGIVAAPDKDLLAASGELIDLANQRGGPDNITVVVARLGGDGLAEPKDGDRVGHQSYHVLDGESTTEPVPVYTGSPPPEPKGAALALLVTSLAALGLAAAIYALT
jgi:protein phosphatase